MSKNLDEEIKGILGITYKPEDEWNELWAKAQSIVRQRDKPTYKEELYELAEKELYVLQVQALKRLIVQEKIKELKKIGYKLGEIPMTGASGKLQSLDERIAELEKELESE